MKIMGFFKTSRRNFRPASAGYVDALRRFLYDELGKGA